MDSQAYISQATTLRQKAVESSRRYGAPAEEAEDIAQETMIRLWQVCPKIDTRQKAEALAVCIAHNLTIDWLRREKRRAPQERKATSSPRGNPDRVIRQPLSSRRSLRRARDRRMVAEATGRLAKYRVHGTAPTAGRGTR